MGRIRAAYRSRFPWTPLIVVLAACGSEVPTGGTPADAGAGGLGDVACDGSSCAACSTDADCPSGETCATVRRGELASRACVRTSPPSTSIDAGAADATRPLPDGGAPSDGDASADGSRDAAGTTGIVGGDAEAGTDAAGTTGIVGGDAEAGTDAAPDGTAPTRNDVAVNALADACGNFAALAARAPTLIRTPAEFAAIASNGHYALDADLDMTGVALSLGMANPLGNVILEGRSHRIANLDHTVGLLGDVRCLAVSELELDDPRVRGTGERAVGSLFGEGEEVALVDVRALRVDVASNLTSALGMVGGLGGRLRDVVLVDDVETSGSVRVTGVPSDRASAGGVFGILGGSGTPAAPTARIAHLRSSTSLALMGTRQTLPGGIAGLVSAALLEDVTFTGAAEIRVANSPGTDACSLAGIAGAVEASTLRRATVRADLDVHCNTGGGQVGGIVGYLNDSTLEDATFEGSIRSRVLPTNQPSVSDGWGGAVGEARDATFRRVRVTLGELSTGGTAAHDLPYVGVGGVLGIAWGTRLEDCEASGPIDAAYAGGLVGRAVRGSSPTVVRRSRSTSDVRGRSLAGGLVAIFGAGTLEDSYASGGVRTDAGGIAGGIVGRLELPQSNDAPNVLRRVYADVTLQGTRRGGLVGQGPVSPPNASDFEASYWNSTRATCGSSIPGQCTPGSWGVLGGEPAASLVLQSTFVGWDFVTTWRLPNGATPRLAWE